MERGSKEGTNCMKQEENMNLNNTITLERNP
jgi:hypothetical protein